MSDADKRAHERFALWFPIKVDSLSKGRTKAIACDASAGGVLIDESTELTLGETVTISFEVPGEGEKFILGQVVRVERDGERRTRVAIAFREPVPQLEELFTRASLSTIPLM